MADLADQVAEFYYDPLGWTYWAFPWGRGALAQEDGPDLWQARVLNDLGEQLKAGAGLTAATRSAVQIACSTGHGTGKTALVAWIILWFISVRKNPQIVVTANTKTQLETKTWREVSKWHKLYVLGDFFNKRATRLEANFTVDGKTVKDTWFCAAIPWTKENSEAFAGTHADDVLVIFDEASGIDDIIWEVVDGAMTTGHCVWVVFGNPTRNTGRFRECFRKFRRSWTCYRVDSRTTRHTNKAKLRRWVEQYGEDSDFVRIRVRGVFPRAGANQLISDAVVEAAQKREPIDHEQFPLIIGVDPARFGDDQTVFYLRQGNATREVKKSRNIDTMTAAGIVADYIKRYHPAAVFVDEIGIGSGVVDRLNQLGHGDIVIGVNVGIAATDDEHYHNKRTEIWCQMRDWLAAGGCIDEQDTELKDDLTGPEYFFDSRNRWMLESKDDMKDRGLDSPDTADALALTFAYPVHAALSESESRKRLERRRRSFMAR